MPPTESPTESPTGPPLCTSVCILADDLTGACDAAVAFSRRGLRTEVILDPTAGLQPESSPEVLACCTATRALAPDQAEATLRPLLKHLAATPPTHLFKKIDSVFRGNTLPEIAETLRAFPNRLAVIAPAFPAHGRTCADGLLHLEDLTGQRSVPLRAQWHTSGLYPRWLASQASAEALQSAMQEAALQPPAAKAFFCEASTDAHLTAIVQAARSLQCQILWIGSGGLAHALATALYPPDPQPSTQLPLRGPLLIVTGTDHPVTVHQLGHLRARYPPGDPSIRHLRLVHGRTTDAEIRAAILLPHPPSTLLLTGGDTALLVCRALGIHALTLHGEFAPGVPLAAAASGLANTTLLLKSGGFGAADLLTGLALQCSSPQEVCA